MTGIKNAAGRSGMGAVMGSKNLKAIAVKGTMDIKIAYPLEALEYNKRFIDQIVSAKVNQTQGTLGTPFIWGATNSWGGIRTRNFIESLQAPMPGNMMKGRNTLPRVPLVENQTAKMQLPF
jgi:aldehyde:ferredoxin oxidoreductase